MMTFRLALLVTSCLLVSQLQAQDTQYMFLQAGKLQLKDDNSTIVSDGTTLSGEFDDLPFFAAGVQKVLGGDRFRYGYEGGGIISWQNDSVSYAARVNGGTQVAVKVDNELFVFGTMLGGYGDIRFSDHVRLFASAGPMVLMASLDQEGDDPEGLSSSSVVVNTDERDFSFGYGAYGSVGLIISPSPKAEFGIVVREQDVELDFSDAVADYPYDGTQYLLSFGYRM